MGKRWCFIPGIKQMNGSSDLLSGTPGAHGWILDKSQILTSPFHMCIVDAMILGLINLCSVLFAVLLMSTLTTYLTPNTCLSTLRLRCCIPKINNASAEQLHRATLPLPLPYKKPCCCLPPQSMLPYTHNGLATCALANSTL